MVERLLEVKGLKTYFFTDEGVVRAVDGIDLYINKGETLGIVGESGSGKTVTALSIMRLIPTPPGRIVEGAIKDRKSTRLNSSHGYISYAVFCLKKKKKKQDVTLEDESITEQIQCRLPT